MQLWRKAAADIWASGLPTTRKLDLILCYFGLRKFATHWVSLGFFCMLVPLSIFTPEVPSPFSLSEYKPLLQNCPCQLLDALPPFCGGGVWQHTAAVICPSTR